MKELLHMKEASPDRFGTISLFELARMPDMRDVEPSSAFGMEMVADLHTLPPHAKSYYIIGQALSGVPLDSWAQHGLMSGYNRKPEFSSFSAVTQGLSDEDKARFAVILSLYLRDINIRNQDFKDRTFEQETLAHASGWVMDMLQSVDNETRKKTNQDVNYDFFEVDPEFIPEPEEELPIAAGEPQRSKLLEWIGKVFGFNKPS